jgi:hypothetical protein
MLKPPIKFILTLIDICEGQQVMQKLKDAKDEAKRQLEVRTKLNFLQPN